MNNNIKLILPNNVKTRITYTVRKLGTKIQIKNSTKHQHKHDITVNIRNHHVTRTI